MAGLENDRQDQYVNVVQNAVEGALQAAIHLDDPNYFGQKQILIMELARAKAYASQLITGPANDSASKATHEIGAIESAGKHKGEIYGGIWSEEYGGDNKPIWFSAAPRLMDHFAAAAWAKEQGGSLPTRKQGGYLTTLKGKGGAFTEIFNRGNSYPAGVWLAEPSTYGRNFAWCQRLSDGDQNLSNRVNELPVLSVRR
jgi:hypothetical protein